MTEADGSSISTVGTSFERPITVIFMALNQVDAPGWIPSALKQCWARCGWCRLTKHRAGCDAELSRREALS